MRRLCGCTRWFSSGNCLRLSSFRFHAFGTVSCLVFPRKCSRAAAPDCTPYRLQAARCAVCCSSLKRRCDVAAQFRDVALTSCAYECACSSPRPLSQSVPAMRRAAARPCPFSESFFRVLFPSPFSESFFRAPPPAAPEDRLPRHGPALRSLFRVFSGMPLA